MRINREKGRSFPHTFLILFLLVVVACMLTYFIPAGQFERYYNEEVGQTLVIQGSYKALHNSPIPFYLIFHKFVEALCQQQTALLIFFILLIGGAFEVIMQTESITAFCSNIFRYLKGYELWIIPIFVFLFSIFGFTLGLTTASIIFVPIGIAVATQLRIPKMCGMAMVALGTNAGFTAGIYNPFSVGTAQHIAELPLYSGASMRWITLIILNVVTSIYIMWYANKHRISGKERKEEVEIKIDCKMMSKRQKFVLIEFVCTFVVLTFGIAKWGWSTKEIIVVFLLASIIIGTSYGFSGNQICELYIVGARRLLKGAFVIGIAATIRLVLNEGNILDTITYNLTNILYVLPKEIQLIGILFLNALLNLFITSGSAKAALIMPILIPIADCLQISRQATVFAFQLGDGLTNLASPVSTTLNGVLAVSEESYETWIMFYLPLIGVYLSIGCILILGANALGYC